MRNLGIIIVLLIWALLGWKGCTDYNSCCVDTAAAAVAAPAVKEEVPKIAEPIPEAEPPVKKESPPIPEPEAKPPAKKIVQVDDRTLIYFPFNSTNKLSDAEIESYLDKVAARVKETGEKVRLTGHTDDIGSSDSNQRLGQRRANIIKQYLIAQGVSSSKIIASSKGETSPVSTNSTDAGRAKNRRTELQIIK